MNTVEYKYPIGTTVYFAQKDNSRKEYPCDTCNSEGVLFRKNGDKITCTSCAGTKYVMKYNDNPGQVVKDFKIESVRIDISSNDTTIYYFDSKYDVFDEKYLYETAGEVQELINK